jgi:hypothetical protein
LSLDRYAAAQVGLIHHAVNDEAVSVAEPNDVTFSDLIAYSSLDDEGVAGPNSWQHAAAGDLCAQGPAAAKNLSRQLTFDGLVNFGGWRRRVHEILVWPAHPC